jgi:hypothetical protein
LSLLGAETRQEGSRVAAFLDGVEIAAGERDEVVASLKRNLSDRLALIVVFDETLGRTVDLIGVEQPEPRKRRGRPTSPTQLREVALTPAQWDWLSEQSGGPTAALRRLVDAARSASGSDPVRRDAAYRFVRATCRQLPGYRETLRAIYGATDDELFVLIQQWPPDLVRYVRKLLSGEAASNRLSLSSAQMSAIGATSRLLVSALRQARRASDIGIVLAKLASSPCHLAEE